MAELTPNNRKEHWLQGIIDGSTELTPENRPEYWLNGIIEGSTDLIPNNRLEHWLKGIIEGSTDLTPENRLEYWLNDIIAGSTELIPENRLEYWFYEIIQNGGGSVIKTLTGNAPLTFDALAAALVSLTQDGKTVQDGTPTPDAPVDIVCNNGTLKMQHRSGLPSGYKLLEYVGGSGSQYIITDVYLASTDVIECEYRNSSTTGYGAVYGVFKLSESSALYGNQTYYGYDQANNKVDTGMSVDTDWHSARHDFVNGTLTIDDTTTTFTPWAFTNTTKNAVLSRYYNGSYGYNWKGFVRKFKVTRGNEVICDLLPAKNSNDVAGLYDLISGNFYTATGGTLLEGNVVDDYELTVDGTPEVLTLAPQTASVADLYAVGNSKDTHELIGGTVKRNVGIKVFDGTEEWVAHTVVGTYRYRFEDKKVEKSPFASTHFVYSSKASGEISNGEMMCGEASTNAYFRNTDCATLDDFTAWLASQYAAGTPVIVLYPLAEETTETVTRQSLRTEKGGNTISVVSNVDPVALTVEYKGEKE